VNPRTPRFPATTGDEPQLPDAAPAGGPSGLEPALPGRLSDREWVAALAAALDGPYRDRPGALEPAIPRLAEALAGDDFAASDAAAVLLRLGRSGAAALARALGGLAGARLELLLEVVRRALDDPALRQGAALLIAALRPDDRRFLRGLRRHLRDPDPAVRAAIRTALRALVPRSLGRRCRPLGRPSDEEEL
jgi:hypothetical protein